MEREVQAWRKFRKVHGNFKHDEVIVLQVDKNPKRGKSGERFNVYQHNMTVGAMIAAYEDKGYTRADFPTPAKLAQADLAWDVWHGFIRVV